MNISPELRRYAEMTQYRLSEDAGTPTGAFIGIILGVAEAAVFPTYLRIWLNSTRRGRVGFSKFSIEQLEDILRDEAPPLYDSIPQKIRTERNRRFFGSTYAAATTFSNLARWGTLSAIAYDWSNLNHAGYLAVFIAASLAYEGIRLSWNRFMPNRQMP